MMMEREMNNSTVNTLSSLIELQDKVSLFDDLYGRNNDGELNGLSRIAALVSNSEFDATQLFSAPGRTELAGNHTDHNLGKVLCAAVQNDSLAAVAKRSDGKVVIKSEGYTDRFEVHVDDLDLHPSELETTTGLIRGVLAGIKEYGGDLGGFSANITSNVSVGSGLSSSASFEVLIGTIISELYNNGNIPPTKIAQISQFAENNYFGKPCGLMDQTASAHGGILSIDFADPEDINIQKVAFDLEATEYALLVVETGSSHADLTDAYASIPEEMKAVAKSLGAEVLRQTDKAELMRLLSSVRADLGDRAVLRALHFYHENGRVDHMLESLKSDDFNGYLKLVGASGASSQNILQNVLPPMTDGKEQGVSFALGLSQLFFEEKKRGQARVHGGGFAGTIQAYVHREDLEEYTELMNQILGPKAVQHLRIRHTGAAAILDLP